MKRSSSYRLALRRSAPPPPESVDLLTKSIENNWEKTKPVVTKQPTNCKQILDESKDIQTESMIIDHKNNGQNGHKSQQFNESNETDSECSKFCCQILCCNYCKCCPNCCSLKMKRLEAFFGRITERVTECSLNCLRVFT